MDPAIGGGGGGGGVLVPGVWAGSGVITKWVVSSVVQVRFPSHHYPAPPQSATILSSSIGGGRGTCLDKLLYCI